MIISGVNVGACAVLSDFARVECCDVVWSRGACVVDVERAVCTFIVYLYSPCGCSNRGVLSVTPQPAHAVDCVCCLPLRHPAAHSVTTCTSAAWHDIFRRSACTTTAR